MSDRPEPSAARRHPFLSLIAARVREFCREPTAIFWVYVFPLILVVALGVAFRNKPVGDFAVAVRSGDHAEQVRQTLERDGRFRVWVGTEQESRLALRTGRADLVIIPSSDDAGGYAYYFDPTQANSVLARHVADDVLQAAAARRDAVAVQDHPLTEPGGRYIDFLIPGLLGMGLLGGGMWGVGFAIVDMRLRKLLKRYLATPMKRSHFLAAVMASRLLFTIPEVLTVLVCARLFFGVTSQGGYGTLGLLILLGAFQFSGIGLLVASRADHRDGFRTDERRDAADVDRLGDFLLDRAISRRRPAGSVHPAADPVDPRLAQRHARRGESGVARPATGADRRLGQRDFRPGDSAVSAGTEQGMGCCLKVTYFERQGVAAGEM